MAMKKLDEMRKMVVSFCLSLKEKVTKCGYFFGREEEAETSVEKRGLRGQSKSL